MTNKNSEAGTTGAQGGGGPKDDAPEGQGGGGHPEGLPQDGAPLPPASGAAAAEAEALASRVQPTGIAGAVERFRSVDEDAQALWMTGGPRNSHTANIGAVLVNLPPEAVGGETKREILLVQAFVSGKFKVFREADIETLIAPPF